MAEKLNPDQAKAVAVDNGPALVVAGAGTGKTKVIVERINRLLDAGTPPGRVLALTFTEKAAAEMLDRVNSLRGSYLLDMPIMTFNAYGESLLRRYAADIGLSRHFTLLGDSAQIVFLRERIDDLELDYFAPVSRPDGLLGDLAAYFSRLKQDVVTPAGYKAFVSKLPAGDAATKLDKKKHSELASAYAHYQRLCREADVVDYDDQIYLLLELFGKRPNILRHVQSAYDYVLVDEFQDTNAMQSQLVDQLAGQHHNLFVVGDDDQSIYGWRGATLANILDFKDRYPKAREVTLLKNYRSSQAILDSAYRLIQNNNPHRLEERLGINKHLVAERAGQAPAIYGFDTIDEELHWIAEDIKRRIAGGANPADIAVLTRRNTTAQLLHGYLDFAGVEHVVSGQRYELYSQPVVRQLLEAIKAVADPTDSTSLYHILTGPLFALPAGLISQYAAQARRGHQTLLEALESAPGTVTEALAQIAAWREKMSNMSVGQLTYEIIESSGYKDALYRQAGDDPAAALAVQRLSELFKTMKQFEQVALQPSAIQYVEALPALRAAGDSNEDGTLDLSGQSVNVLTIHKAKGLEWPVVYIADCTEGSFPLRENFRGIAVPDGLLKQAAPEADAHLSEERRLMYVAMTRAKDELILTRAERHGTATIRKPSRFLAEAFGGGFDSQSPAAEPFAALNLDRHAPIITSAVPLPSNMLRGEKLNLSVSQVQKFLGCPLDFYYSYVLNVPQESSPTLEYGSIMHGLLETINNSLLAGELVSLDVLRQQLDADWPKTGYLSKRHRDRSRAQAVKSLEQLYARTTAGPRQPLAVEQAFSLSLPECQLTIKGRLDAVFPLGEGVEIVDYKTSTSVDTPEKAKQRASASQQLTLYALAWQLLHGELPSLVSLDFIDTGMRGSVKKTQRGIDNMELRLAQAAQDIRAQNFQPGKDHLFCVHPPL